MSNVAITLDNLPDGVLLSHRQAISGRAWGPGTIQCLVLSADSRWYTQRPVFRTDTNQWGCMLVFGFEDWTHPTYYLAAGIGGERILEPSVTQLPGDALWVFASIQRKR